MNSYLILFHSSQTPHIKYLLCKRAQLLLSTFPARLTFSFTASSLLTFAFFPHTMCMHLQQPKQRVEHFLTALVVNSLKGCARINPGVLISTTGRKGTMIADFESISKLLLKYTVYLSAVCRSKSHRVKHITP